MLKNYKTTFFLYYQFCKILLTMSESSHDEGQHMTTIDNPPSHFVEGLHPYPIPAARPAEGRRSSSSSYQRKPRQPTPPETLSPHAPRMKFVARPFPAGSQTNLGGDEDFSEEEAVCKFCFMKVGEESVIMMTKCRCKSSLAHEECASRWFKTNGNNCEVCVQEVNLVNCTLLGSQKFHNEIQSNGSSSGSWLRRLSLFGKGK